MSECQEETEQVPGEGEQAVEWVKVGEDGIPAAWADPAQQDLQATAYARNAVTGRRTNAEFPARRKSALTAGLR